MFMPKCERVSATRARSPVRGSHLDVLSASSKCRDEITPYKSASVYECIRSCRYTVSSECRLMKTGLCAHRPVNDIAMFLGFR